MSEQTAAPPLLSEPGVMVAVGFTLSLVLAAVLGHVPVGPAEGTACFAVEVAVLAVAGRRRAALAHAGIAWAMLTGFVVHRLGALTFAPGDLARCAVLVAVGLGAAHLTRPTADVRHPSGRHTRTSRSPKPCA